MESIQNLCLCAFVEMEGQQSRKVVANVNLKVSELIYSEQKLSVENPNKG